VIKIKDGIFLYTKDQKVVYSSSSRYMYINGYFQKKAYLNKAD